MRYNRQDDSGQAFLLRGGFAWTSLGNVLPAGFPCSALGSAAATRIPTACCDSISREEQISRASLRRTSTGSRCGSINARARPWASKPLPIDYEQCCSDRLNPQPKADVACGLRRQRRTNKGDARKRICADSGASNA